MMTSMSDSVNAESRRHLRAACAAVMASRSLSTADSLESQHIACVLGADCRLEVFTIIGIVHPADPPEPGESSSVQLHNSAAPTGRERNRSLIPRPGSASLAVMSAQLITC